jgi:hypothetical protein
MSGSEKNSYDYLSALFLEKAYINEELIIANFLKKYDQ